MWKRKKKNVGWVDGRRKRRTMDGVVGWCFIYSI